MERLGTLPCARRRRFPFFAKYRFGLYRGRYRTMESVLESHGPLASFEPSIVQSPRRVLDHSLKIQRNFSRIDIERWSRRDLGRLRAARVRRLRHALPSFLKYSERDTRKGHFGALLPESLFFSHVRHDGDFFGVLSREDTRKKHCEISDRAFLSSRDTLLESLE